MRYLYLLPLAIIMTACYPAPKSSATHQTTQPSTKPKKSFCTKIYLPVCAKVEVACITTPCKPVEQTFSNKCMMENNERATFLHDGKCK